VEDLEEDATRRFDIFLDSFEETDKEAKDNFQALDPLLLARLCLGLYVNKAFGNKSSMPSQDCPPLPLRVSSLSFKDRPPPAGEVTEVGGQFGAL